MQPRFFITWALISVLVCSTCILEAQGSIRHLYWTCHRNPCHSLTVHIHGVNTSSYLSVEYDTTPSFSGAKKIEAKGISFMERILYQIELSNLQPDTRYYVKVLDKVGSFKTVPEKGKLRFVEGGDWENTAEAAQLAQLAASYSPHLVLLGGDYPSLVFSSEDYKKWDEWLDTYTHHMVTPEGCLIPLVAAIGNHEVIGFGSSKKQAPFFFHYLRAFSEEGSYFFLPIGQQVGVYVLDSGHIEPHGGPQAEWLAAQLALHAEKPIKIALYHIPLFPSVHFYEKNGWYRFFYALTQRIKGSSQAKKLFSREAAQGRKYWLPLFEQYGLTVAFEHHDQALKRTNLIEGVLYLGDGGWGSRFHYPPLQRYLKPYFRKVKGNVQFFWLMDIEENNVVYRAISINNKCLDSFTQPYEQAP